mmetsp:Transcript_40958/g.132717  ORF Transcript_40958/g.132717 Transcript_40958/m.132717 type:complete len:88 (-) Transcript_40958:23-286(-)
MGYYGIGFTGAQARRLTQPAPDLRVPRHVLRRLLYDRLAPGTVRWGWRLRSYLEEKGGRGVCARFERVAARGAIGGGAGEDDNKCKV